jgi:nicotinamidase-related amidase
MPVSTIDPTPALVVIDLQKGLAGIATVHPFDEIVARSAGLAAAFRRHDLPVVLVNVAGVAPGRTEAGSFRAAGATMPPDWTELVPELGAEPSDLRITKQRVGAFHGTMLDSHLRERGVTQIVLTGVATTMGVEATARAAHEHGYHVVLATDAMTDRDADAHRNSIERIFPRLGEAGTTTEILDLLDSTR